MTEKIKPPDWKRYPGHYPFDSGMGDALLSPALGWGNVGGGERIAGSALAVALRRGLGMPAGYGVAFRYRVEIVGATRMGAAIRGVPGWRQF